MHYTYTSKECNEKKKLNISVPAQFLLLLALQQNQQQIIEIYL